MKTKIKTIEITPMDARCGVGPCPAIFKTNQQYKQYNCIGLGCPSVFKTANEMLIVIGSIAEKSKLPKNVLRKIGKGEIAIEIPANILPTL
ncbi:MAG: hypothetical protein Q7R78_02065 [bacterium]|nr:hypothetical protein [bacterium]